MNTQKIFLITLFLALFASCAPKKEDSGGGGGTTTVIPDTQKCLDLNATNRGSRLPCVCDTGFVVNSFGTGCNVSTGGTTGTGGGGGLAPNALFYSNNPWSMLVGVLTTPQGPSVSNCGSPNTCTFSVVGSTALPSGLSLNSTSGVISGIPNNIGNRTVRIRASNSIGFTDSDLTIRVLYPAPSGLTVNNLVSGGFYAVGNIVPTISFTYSSMLGSVDTMTISPSLPSGLTFNLIDAINRVWGINGTFSASSPVREYTVTACGPTSPCASVKFNIGAGLAPSNFSYNVSGHPNCSVGGDNIPSCVFTKLSAFPDIPATVSGDSISYQILSGGQGSIPVNELPSGIALKGTDGSIYGTSFGAFENTNQCNAAGPGTCLYTIRAFNNLGSVSTQIKIKIIDGNPATAFSYPGSPFVFRTLTAISDINPVWVNGNLPSCHGQSGCYSISPSLPTGAGLSPLTGRISGTPNQTAITGPAIYTITANNIQGGSPTPISTTVSIEVKERLPIFGYNNNGDYVFFKDQSVASNGTPSIIQTQNILCGSTAIPITSFSVSPALPQGLSLNTNPFECGIAPEDTGGAITGTPTALSQLLNYTITGCNSGGCTSVVIKIEVPASVQKVVSGEKHACAIIKDGSASPGRVVCWGDNSLGQLGYVSTDTCEGQSCSLTAKNVRNASNAILTDVIDISAGKNHTCVLINPNPVSTGNPTETNQIQEIPTGTLHCWGDNSSGQLMSGTAGGFNRVPSIVNGQSKVSLMALGDNQTCFAGEFFSSFMDETDPTQGHVYCSNIISSGNAGYSRKTDPSEIVSLQQLFFVKQLVAGKDFFCAESNDIVEVNGESEFGSSRTKCWGNNSKGQLGSGNFINSSNPVNVLFSGSSETTVQNLVAGGQHACYSKDLDSSGNKVTRCWGDNANGQLGRGTVLQSNQAISLNNETGATLIGAISVGATAQATFVTRADPSVLWTTGAFTLPGLPYVGNETFSLIPIKDSLNNNLVVAAEAAPVGAFSENFACTISQRREILCWGENNLGQLGDNTLIDKVLPTKVVISN